MRTARFARNERLVMRANNRIPLETLRRSLGRVAQDVERGGSVVVEPSAMREIVHRPSYRPPYLSAAPPARGITKPFSGAANAQAVQQY